MIISHKKSNRNFFAHTIWIFTPALNLSLQGFIPTPIHVFNYSKSVSYLFYTRALPRRVRVTVALRGSTKLDDEHTKRSLQLGRAFVCCLYSFFTLFFFPSLHRVRERVRPKKRLRAICLCALLSIFLTLTLCLCPPRVCFLAECRVLEEWAARADGLSIIPPLPPPSSYSPTTCRTTE